jgi:superfamily II DNA or RNA helicase
LGRAMVKGYVKQLVKKEFIPEELTFRVSGYDRELSLEEVLQIKDQDWVSRTVAYSPHCSASVVQRSIELMREKREATGVPHKIIAVACSIEHAIEIKKMFEEKGCPCSIVHSDMESDEIELARTDFHNDRTHAIVNVGMLGEGYDHPYISIAAIFRPFKSKSAYAQFAGRALRAIPDAKIPSIDNVAHLVYHSALDLEELWEYYKKEQQKAEIIQDLQNSLISSEDTGEHRDSPSKIDIGIAEQSEKFYFSVDTFIDDENILQEYEKALAESKLKTDEAVEALKEKGIPITDELVKLLQGSTFEDITKSKRPDLELKELRKELTVFVQERVAEIITNKGLDPKAPAGEIALKFGRPWDAKMKLDGFCVKFINDYLRRYIGYPREQWSIEDYKKARPEAEKNLDYLEERL